MISSQTYGNRAAEDVFVNIITNTRLYEPLKTGDCYNINEITGCIDAYNCNFKAKPEMVNDFLEFGEKIGLIIKKENCYQATDRLNNLMDCIPTNAWAFMAYKQYWENIPEFFSNPQLANITNPRSGHWTAVSSEWIGDQTYYEPIFKILKKISPNKIVDVGAGTGVLIGKALQKIPNSEGVIIEISKEACCAAERKVKSLDLESRVKICQLTAESLVEKIPQEAQKSDVIIHAFLFHELKSHGDDFLIKYLRAISRALTPNGRIIIVDAVIESKEDTTKFGALFEFVHTLQGKQLFQCGELEDIFKKAGLEIENNISAILPSSRLYELKRSD